MSDGCDGVTIERSSRDGKNPYRHIVTIDADRHCFGGSREPLYKGSCAGCCPQTTGAAPLIPLGERNALLMAPLSKVLLRYFWKK